jgi:predicted phage terminase large subunit-like protein
VSNLSQRDFEKQFSKLVESIRTQATPFPKDTTEKKIARVKRAKADKFYYAATYFPHYIQLNEELPEVVKLRKGDSSVVLNWVKAGFAECHADFFAQTELRNKFSILAAFRESAKDTLLGKIDPLHKLFCEEAWFIPIIAYSTDHAETKVIPLKLEIENNERLKNDFGDLKGVVKWEQNEFITKNGRKVQGFGMDVPLRGQENFGHRPDYIILNDIEDPTKTFNHGLCQQNVERIRQDKLKSVNSPRWGAIYLCNYISKQSITYELMTGENTGHFIKKIYPALVPNMKLTQEEQQLAREAKKHGFVDLLKSNWEFRHPTMRLLQEQKDDPDTFDCEMMQRPRDRKNKKFKDTDFRFYADSEVRNIEMAAWTFIDPSAKAAGDYKAIITLGMPVKAEMFQLYVLAASIQQESIDWLLEETYQHHTRYKSKVVGVEMISFASLLEREYQRLMKKKGTYLPIHKVERVENKDAKIESLVPLIRSGLIKFNPQQGDQALLIRQLKGFPDKTPVSRGGIGDDGPDAMAECVKLVQDFPHGEKVEYKSVVKRQAVFAEGAF